MEQYVKVIFELPTPLREEIFAHFNQQDLSRALCAMTPLGVSEEVLQFRNLITKFSKQRSQANSHLPGVGRLVMPDFDSPEPNFI